MIEEGFNKVSKTSFLGKQRFPSRNIVTNILFPLAWYVNTKMEISKLIRYIINDFFQKFFIWPKAKRGAIVFFARIRSDKKIDHDYHIRAGAEQSSFSGLFRNLFHFLLKYFTFLLSAF